MFTLCLRSKYSPLSSLLPTPPSSSAFPAAEAGSDAASYRPSRLSLTSCPFLAEPQAQFRGDLLNSRAALHGKGGGSGLVLQPAPEGKTDQLPDAVPHQITHLQLQTGERLWAKELHVLLMEGKRGYRTAFIEQHFAFF